MEPFSLEEAPLRAENANANDEPDEVQDDNEFSCGADGEASLDAWSLIPSEERKYYAAVEFSADDGNADSSRDDQAAPDDVSRDEHMVGGVQLWQESGGVCGAEDRESEHAEEDPTVDPTEAVQLQSPPETALASGAVSRVPHLVTHALFGGRFAGEAKLPWETSPVFADVLPSSFLKFTEPLGQSASQTVAKPATASDVTPFAVSTAVFARAIAGKRDEDFLAERATVLRKAVRMWSEVCMAVGPLCEPGSLVARDDPDATEVEQCVTDCIGVRSPFTVRKRAYAMAGFKRWVELAEDFNADSFVCLLYTSDAADEHRDVEMSVVGGW